MADITATKIASGSPSGNVNTEVNEIRQSTETGDYVAIEFTPVETFQCTTQSMSFSIPAEGIRPYNYNNSSKPNSYNLITTSNLTTYREPFAINSIDIEYYATEEVVYYSNIREGKCNDTLILHEKGNVWDPVKAKESYSEATVRLKLGDIILEFTQGNDHQAGQPTVTVDPVEYTIGSHRGVALRSYLTPGKFTFDRSDAKILTAKFNLNRDFNTTASRAYYSKMNINGNAWTDGTIMTSEVSKIKTSYEILKLTNANGLANTVESKGNCNISENV